MIFLLILIIVLLTGCKRSIEHHKHCIHTQIEETHNKESRCDEVKSSNNRITIKDNIKYSKGIFDDLDIFIIRVDSSEYIAINKRNTGCVSIVKHK